MAIRTEDDGIPIGLDETATLQMLANGELNEKFPDALKKVPGDYCKSKKFKLTCNLCCQIAAYCCSLLAMVSFLTGAVVASHRNASDGDEDIWRVFVLQNRTS